MHSQYLPLCARREVAVGSIDSRGRGNVDCACDEEQPWWSPGGTEITFCSDRSGRTQIYAVKADGSGQPKLTANAYSPRPRWLMADEFPYQVREWSLSPDGTMLAFAGTPKLMRVLSSLEPSIWVSAIFLFAACGPVAVVFSLLSWRREGRNPLALLSALSGMVASLVLILVAVWAVLFFLYAE